MLAVVMLVCPSLSEAQIVEEGHSGLDFYVGSGLSAKDGVTILPFEAIISKPVSPGLSFGFGGGYESVRANGAKSSQIPLFLDGKVSFRLGNGVGSLGELRLGYSIGQDVKIKSGKKTYKVDGADGFIINVMPAGMRFALGKRVDLDVVLGISTTVPADGGKAATYFGGRLGLNFHKANKTYSRYSVNQTKEEKPKKPKIVYPTRKNGFEIGIEGVCLNGYGASLLLGYKVNPKLSFALGTEVTGGKSYDSPEWTKSYFSQKDGEGEPFMERHGDKEADGFDGGAWVKIFLRGEYRFVDKRFSPIARVDIGYGGSSDGVLLQRDLIAASSVYDFDGKTVGGILVRPAIGFSWRCTKNSYLEAAVGYEFISGVKSIDKVYNQSGNYDGKGSKHYESIRLKEGGVDFSGLTLGLTWKRTIKWFSTTKPLK